MGFELGCCEFGLKEGFRGIRARDLGWKTTVFIGGGKWKIDFILCVYLKMRGGMEMEIIFEIVVTERLRRLG